MKVQIKVLSREGASVGRAFYCEIEDAQTGKEVLDEVYRGRQAVGNGWRTMIRCGEDKEFFGITTKNEILTWIEKRLKEDKN